MLLPPLAIAECGFCGELGLTPTTYGTANGTNTSGTDYSRGPSATPTGHWVVAQSVPYLTLRKVLGSTINDGDTEGR